MRGNITRRGKSSWRLKFDLGIDVATGKRQTQFVTVRGTKKEAEAELSRRLNQVEEGSYVEKTAATVDEYCQHWLKAIAPSKA
ncbi:site-specific integrase, partial [Mesorhizobium sp. M4B.F.Ca.ET.088.02.2.1]